MNIDPEESHREFMLHRSVERDFKPEGLPDIVIEWAENVVSGEYSIITHQDSRKYEYRVRAVRMSNRNILMDIGKYVQAHIAHKHVDKFIEAQKALEEYRR